MATTRRLLPEEERRIFASFVKMRDHVLFMVQRLAGFRISEALSLRVEDVWDGRAVKPEIALRRGRLKGGRGCRKRRVHERIVPVHPRLKAALQNLINSRFGDSFADPRSYLFTGRKSRPGVHGEPIGRMRAYGILRAAAIATGNGNRVGTHSLRKSFAHEIYERSGHNLVLTQRVMGHTSVLTTVRYLHIGKEEAAEAVMGLEGPLGFPDQPATPNCLNGAVEAVGSDEAVNTRGTGRSMPTSVSVAGI